MLSSDQALCEFVPEAPTSSVEMMQETTTPRVDSSAGRGLVSMASRMLVLATYAAAAFVVVLSILLLAR